MVEITDHNERSLEDEMRDYLAQMKEREPAGGKRTTGRSADAASETLDDLDDIDDYSEEGVHQAMPPPPWAEAPEMMELKYTNGDTYSGLVLREKRHGEGTHTCSNGDVYTGEWRDDVRHGRGKMLFTNGMMYEGEWKEDKASGEGRCSYPNGDKYEGEWQNDQRWGWGILSVRSGAKYEGVWYDNAMHGQGRYDFEDGAFFEGEYVMSQRWNGRYVSADASIEYNGEWRNDKRHGKGTFFHKGVYSYTGSWQNDLRHGQEGTCHYADGSSYSGGWSEDLRSGKGVLKLVSGDKYEGDFKNDEEDGEGECLFENGDRYRGEWKMGKRSGRGRCSFSNGDKYDGEWSKGLREGKGICKYANGDTYQGLWSRNKRHGYGVCLFHDGTRFRGEWEEDEWIQSTADPMRSQVFGPGISRATAGTEASFGIQAFDEDGNKRLSGGDAFAVLVQCGGNEEEEEEVRRKLWGSVEDNGDGTYIVTYTATVSGQAEVFVMLGANEPVASSPFTLTIDPGMPVAARTIVRGTGHKSAVKYSEAFFTLTFHDAFGNRSASGIRDLRISVCGPQGEAVPHALDRGKGSVTIHYTPSISGFHRLTVNCGETAIPGSPFSIQVRDALAITGEEVIPDQALLALRRDPVEDTVTKWENIARREYAADGDVDGYESESEEEETEAERMARLYPGIPVIENLEDLWKVGKVQKAMKDAKRRERQAKVKAAQKRIQMASAPVITQGGTTGNQSSTRRVRMPSGGLD